MINFQLLTLNKALKLLKTNHYLTFSTDLSTIILQFTAVINIHVNFQKVILFLHKFTSPPQTVQKTADRPVKAVCVLFQQINGHYYYY